MIGISGGGLRAGGGRRDLLATLWTLHAGQCAATLMCHAGNVLFCRVQVSIDSMAKDSEIPVVLSNTDALLMLSVGPPRVQPALLAAKKHMIVIT